MTYVLKPHVTDEMLIECGFIVKQIYIEKWYIRENQIENEHGEILDDHNGIIICHDDNPDVYQVLFNFDNRNDTDDITPYIKDLIQLDYVEEVK